MEARGSPDGAHYRINLTKTTRSSAEINMDIQTTLTSEGFEWFKDYLIDITSTHLDVIVYNEKVRKFLPKIIVEDLI